MDRLESNGVYMYVHNVSVSKHFSIEVFICLNSNTDKSKYICGRMRVWL